MLEVGSWNPCLCWITLLYNETLKTLKKTAWIRYKIHLHVLDRIRMNADANKMIISHPCVIFFKVNTFVNILASVMPNLILAV